MSNVLIDKFIHVFYHVETFQAQTSRFWFS